MFNDIKQAAHNVFGRLAIVCHLLFLLLILMTKIWATWRMLIYDESILVYVEYNLIGLAVATFAYGIPCLVFAWLHGKTTPQKAIK